jgi:serine/threonine protein kinase
LTLETYGYTFVAKGTVEAFRKKLRHEADVYRHLHKVQGQLVPVYLGSVSLKRPYFLDVGVRIVHMLMMSGVGEKVEHDLAGPTRPWDTNATDFKTAVAVEELHRHGVQHNDVRPPNVLWSVELRKVMLIDFVRSKLLREVPAFAGSSPKHRRQHPKEGTFQFPGKFCKEEFRAEPEWVVQASNIVV